METKSEIKNEHHRQFVQGQDPYVEVYIPVSFYSHCGSEANYPLKKNYKNNIKFAQEFDFARLAQSLNKLSSAYDLRVGITDEEAVNIVNEHKHSELMSIVKVQVARDSLAHQDNGKNYQTMYYKRNQLHYCIIKKGTVYRVEALISARAMRHENEYSVYDFTKNIYLKNEDHHKNEYWNSFYNGPAYPNDFWPKGLLVENPAYSNQLKVIKEEPKSVLPTFFKQVPNQTNNPLEEYLNQCSKTTREYVLSIKDKPKLSERILKLALSVYEEAAFEKFKDGVVSLDYMDIPVCLNEKYYDLTTLIGLTRDPNTTDEFSPLQISPARTYINELEEAIKRVIVTREKESPRNNVCNNL